MRSARVIADIGINHNGDLEIAKQLVDHASLAGAWAVKLQKRSIEHCYTAQDLAQICESPWGTTVGDKVRGRELSWDSIDVVEAHCRDRGIAFTCSCFDLRSLYDLEDRYGDRLACHKVPSAMAKWREYLGAVASLRRLTLVSTGLLTMRGVEAAAKIFEASSCPYVLMHCVALYPAPPDRLNLRVIQAMRGRFLDDPDTWPHCRAVGYSGHEVGELPAVIAAYMGAEYIERHVTVDRSLYGADQAASLEPQGLRRLVRDINVIQQIDGSSAKTLCGDEKNPVTHFDSNVKRNP